MILNNTNKAEEKRFANKLRALQNKQQFSNEKDSFDCYINLSNYELSEDEKKFLNFGLNFHIEGRYDRLHKKTEIENLYQELVHLYENNKIEIHNNLADELRREGNKHRYKPSISIISPNLYIPGI